MTEFVEGPVIELGEVTRLQGKICEKTRQLPLDKPGIIVISTDENLLFPAYPLAEIIQGVVERVKRFPNVFAVVVTHACLSGNEGPLVVEIGEHTYARYDTESVTTHHTLIVRNPACANFVSESLERRIQDAFMRHCSEGQLSNA